MRRAPAPATGWNARPDTPDVVEVVVVDTVDLGHDVVDESPPRVGEVPAVVETVVTDTDLAVEGPPRRTRGPRRGLVVGVLCRVLASPARVPTPPPVPETSSDFLLNHPGISRTGRRGGSSSATSRPSCST